MKSSFLIVFACFAFLNATAQNKAPEQIGLTTNFERIEIIKMLPGADLLDGFNQAVQERKIKNAVILTGIGSVTDYCFHVVSDKNLPPAQEYPKASVAMDVVNTQGYIMNGRVHAHILFGDGNSSLGGHLEKGTKALTFYIVTIGVLPDNLNIENLDSYK
jgi:predicted DNA-binding protein with PD1-like motif